MHSVSIRFMNQCSLFESIIASLDRVGFNDDGSPRVTEYHLWGASA